MTHRLSLLPAIALATFGLTAFGPIAAPAQDAQPDAAMAEALAKFQQDEATAAKNLDTFDTLDFEVYSNQDWDRLHESHAQDITVHYPDGSTTTGIDAHIAALAPMFVFAPDTRIKEHPIRIGSGEWTSVIGFIEGTFTQPMPLPDGTQIEPTGKPFRMRMATIGHWTPEGVMDEEYLFWDNQDFMKQIGVGQ